MDVGVAKGKSFYFNIVFFLFLKMEGNDLYANITCLVYSYDGTGLFTCIINVICRFVYLYQTCMAVSY